MHHFYVHHILLCHLHLLLILNFYIPQQLHLLLGLCSILLFLTLQYLYHTHKLTPPDLKPKWGQLEYMFQDNIHSEEAKNGIRFIENNKGKVCIIEHPIKSENGTNFRNLYVAGIDGIDMGMNDTSESTRDPSDF